MDTRELWRLDATAQAALVRAREVSAGELLDAAIARIEALNPQINAVITTLFDEARAQIASGFAADAPFAGVPMLLKDASIEVAGTPHYCGLGVLRDIGHRSTRTTELAQRLRDAGFVFAGKTNTPALSAGVTTETAAFGPARNPWDISRSTGGSSGGSAAAVAAGMTSIAHGADGTGSLRYPAACCGVMTLKPSRGLVPSEAAHATDDLQVWSEFVLTRSVRDLAGVLDAVGNRDTPDAGTYAERLSEMPKSLRVGLLTHDVMTNGAFATDGACVAAVQATGRALESMGHRVEESHPPALDGLFVRTMPSFDVVGAVARRSQIDWLAGVLGRAATGDDVEGEFVSADAVAAFTPDQIAAATEALRRETAPIVDWWADHDVLVTPTCRQPAWPLGSKKGAFDAGVFPPPFSFTGQPALSLPAAWTPEGLPIGVQLVGAPGRDALLLQLAARLEEALPGTDRWPTDVERGE